MPARKNQVFHTLTLFHEIQNRILCHAQKIIAQQPLNGYIFENTAVSLHIICREIRFPMKDPCIANHQITIMYRPLPSPNDILSLASHDIQQLQAVFMAVKKLRVVRMVIPVNIMKPGKPRMNRQFFLSIIPSRAALVLDKNLIPAE